MLRKDFIARTSIAIINKTYSNAQQHFSNISDRQRVREIAAEDAVIIAEELADALEKFWHDDRTTFFDPEDQPTTGIEECLIEIKEAIENLYKD